MAPRGRPLPHRLPPASMAAPPPLPLRRRKAPGLSPAPAPSLRALLPLHGPGFTPGMAAGGSSASALRRAGNEEFRRGQYGPAAQLYGRALALLEDAGEEGTGPGAAGEGTGRGPGGAGTEPEPEPLRCAAQGRPPPRRGACCSPTAPPATSRRAPAASASPTAAGEPRGSGGTAPRGASPEEGFTQGGFPQGGVHPKGFSPGALDPPRAAAAEQRPLEAAPSGKCWWLAPLRHHTGAEKAPLAFNRWCEVCRGSPHSCLLGNSLLLPCASQSVPLGNEPKKSSLPQDLFPRHRIA